MSSMSVCLFVCLFSLHNSFLVVRIQFRSTEVSVTEGSCPLELELLKSGATLYDVVVNVSTVTTQGTATGNMNTDKELLF